MNHHLYESAQPASRDTASSAFLQKWLPPLTVIVVGGALSLSPTSSAAPSKAWEAPFVHEQGATVSGWSGTLASNEVPGRASETTRQAVLEVRRVSGLTWEQLADLFSVSRRSVHAWASGKPLSASNENRLMRVLEIVRLADRGNARTNRSAFLEVRQGTSTIELLAAEKYSEARSRLGVGTGRRHLVLGPLSANAEAARTPPKPEELVDALSDRIHKDPGRARAARTVRNSRRGTP